jgi:hypothetical protein
MADGADFCLALAKAKTDSELLEHVWEYETAMWILDIFWSDSGPAAAKVTELRLNVHVRQHEFDGKAM